MVVGAFGLASVFLNQGDGSFAPPVHNDALGQVRSVAIGDLDGDGKADLAVGVGVPHTSYSMVVLLNQGSGAFTVGARYGDGFYSDAVAVGDLDGDGKADVAAGLSTWNPWSRVSTHRVRVYLNQGDGSLAAAGDWAQTTGDNEYGKVSVAIADLNGDGRLDLAAGNKEANLVSVLVQCP